MARLLTTAAPNMPPMSSTIRPRTWVLTAARRTVSPAHTRHFEIAYPQVEVAWIGARVHWDGCLFHDEMIRFSGERGALLLHSERSCLYNSYVATQSWPEYKFDIYSI
jgi:hypothetical protein